MLRRSEEARQIDAPGWLHNHTILAMIYGQLGQQEQAWAAVRRILQLDPDFEKNAWYEVQLRNFPESMVEQMIDGLRKAGLRIPAQPPRKIRAASLDWWRMSVGSRQALVTARS